MHCKGSESYSIPSIELNHSMYFSNQISTLFSFYLFLVRFTVLFCNFSLKIILSFAQGIYILLEFRFMLLETCYLKKLIKNFIYLLI